MARISYAFELLCCWVYHLLQQGQGDEVAPVSHREEAVAGLDSGHQKEGLAAKSAQYGMQSQSSQPKFLLLSESSGNYE